MKILVINQSPISYFKDILFELGKNNEVTLFCGEKDEYCPKFINYIFSERYIRNSFYLRIKSWVLFSLHLFFYLIINSYKYKKILIVSNPPFAIWFSLVCPNKVSIFLFDIYPDVIKQLDIRSKFLSLFIKLLSFIWKLLNSLSYLFVEKIFTISNSMRTEILNSNILFNLKKSKIRIIYPWGNLPSYSQLKIPFNFKQRLINDDRLLILYAGNIGLTHPLECLIQSSDYINELAKIVIIGNGSKKKSLENIHLQSRYKNTSFLDRVSLDELPLFLKSSDLCVICIDGPAAKYSLPSKFFTALSCSKPVLVIAPEDSELAKIVNKYNCGFVLSQGDEFKIKLYNILDNLQNKKNLLKILSLNASKASKKFNKKNSIKFVQKFMKL